MYHFRSLFGPGKLLSTRWKRFHKLIIPNWFKLLPNPLFLFQQASNMHSSYQNKYRPNFYESTCLRCNETVYQVDRVGPLKDFTFFHTGCFKCAVCGSKLTLKTYYNNQHRQEDKEVYCNSHVPKIGPGHLDGSSVVIRSALNVPKSSSFVNEQIRGPTGRGSVESDGE